MTQKLDEQNFLPNFFFFQNFFYAKICFTQNFFWPKKFLNSIFFFTTFSTGKQKWIWGDRRLPPRRRTLISGAGGRPWHQVLTEEQGSPEPTAQETGVCRTGAFQEAQGPAAPRPGRGVQHDMAFHSNRLASSRGRARHKSVWCMSAVCDYSIAEHSWISLLWNWNTSS